MTTQKLNYGMVDDFLPMDEFQSLQSLLIPSERPEETPVGWTYSPTITSDDKSKDWKYFYLNHTIYINTQVYSPILYEKMSPILNRLDVKALMRIKCNLYPNSEKVHEHEKHFDYDYSHNSAIFSINTCDGYTKLEDGTKIDSVANRMLLFDGSKPHSSSTTTDQPVRVNININYF